jgi:nitrogen fixation NifU-like protein
MRLIGTSATDKNSIFPLKNARYHGCHGKTTVYTDPVSPELIDHFRNPRNVGELPPPAITVEASNPVCGDILRLSVRMEEGRVAEVAYKVRGCAASIAAGSALTVLMEGQERAALSLISRASVESAVGGLSNESKHAAALCVDAVRAILKKC